MTKWNKYSYLNTNNDCLIEVTHLEGTEEKLLHTPLNESPYILLSVEPATIQPINEKEKKMQDMQYDVNATMLVRTTDYTTGVITDVPVTPLDVETMRRKINNLETRLTYHEKMITQIKENLTYAGWYKPSTDKEDILADLCSIVGHEPVATLRFSATITVEGSVDVPLSEVDDYDLRYDLNDDLTVDSHNGNMEIDSYYVDDIVNQEWE
jgi:hypothetical protein